MSQNNPYRRAVERLDPPDYLDERVLERMRCMHLQEAVQPSARGAHYASNRSRPTSVTRRHFVAAGAGAAACLGAMALGIGLFGRGVTDSDPGSTGQLAYVDRPFGLAIAAEAEPGVPIELETRPDSLMPINGQIGWHYFFKMNLACVGEGVETVTYTIRDAPTVMAYVNGPIPDPPDQSKPKEVSNVSFGYVEYECWDRDGGESWSNEQVKNDTWQIVEFTVDVLQNPGWDGTEHYDWGSICWALEVADQEGFWACDPLVEAKSRWMDANVVYGQQELANQLYGEYVTLFNQTCGTYEGAAVWLRSCHAKALRLAGNMLAQAMLDVRATFIDGAQALRSYRIEPVENLEEVANARFDALLERYGLGDEAFDPLLAPFYNFEDYVPTTDEPDPRLTAPLFRITDVTA